MHHALTTPRASGPGEESAASGAGRHSAGNTGGDHRSRYAVAHFLLGWLGGLGAALRAARDVAALCRLLAASPAVVAAEPLLDPTSPALQPAGPYAVARFWFDGDVAPERGSPASRVSPLDSISVYSRLEDEARAWATRTGGSVVELHAYGTTAGLDEEQIVARMRAELAALWPETSSLNTLDVRWRIQANAPLFATGASALRPGVTTRAAAGLRLAGDWVHADFPTALMERAAATGVLAANDILVSEGVAPGDDAVGAAARPLAPLGAS